MLVHLAAFGSIWLLFTLKPFDITFGFSCFVTAFQTVPFLLLVKRTICSVFNLPAPIIAPLFIGKDSVLTGMNRVEDIRKFAPVGWPNWLDVSPILKSSSKTLETTFPALGAHKI